MIGQRTWWHGLRSDRTTTLARYRTWAERMEVIKEDVLLYLVNPDNTTLSKRIQDEIDSANRIHELRGRELWSRFDKWTGKEFQEILGINIKDAHH